MIALPLAALALGLVGSTHCVAMCGGMVGLGAAARGRRLPMADAPRRTVATSLAQHGGRLGSYALAGALAGGAGRLAVASWQVGLELLAGVFMVGLGLFLCGLLPSFARVESLGAPLWRALRPLGRRLLPIRTPWQALGFGVLWGFLPCGLVYSALSLAVVAGSAPAGAVAMLAFGAGTLPALLAVSAALGALRRFAGSAKLRIAGGALVTMLGAVHLTLAAEKLQDPHASCHAASASER
jgi:sulfite exporter TauE/SafE